VTKSVLTEPVFGNNAGEPCYSAAGFGSSWCQQAYRWNLDYVVDARGNSMTYFWTKLSGKYGLNNNASAQLYDVSATLEHIDYGTRAGSEAFGSAPMRVTFTTAGRCLNSCVHSDYPDTPWDQYCDPIATSCPGLLGPSYFTPYRLTTVTTQVWSAGTSAYRNVDRWDLAHAFPPSGDYISPAGNDTNPNLWFDDLTHVGYAADGTTTLAEPMVHFGGDRFANRVDWGDSIGVAPYTHFRLTQIINGMGGQTLVGYSPVECANRAPKQNSDANPYRCFPQYSKPIQAPAGWDFFNKYVVTSVTEQDLTGGSPDETWSYDYSTAGSTDNSLWAHDLNEISPIAYTSWAQWRGYSTVTTTHGVAGGPQTVTRNLYLRGMDGDAKKSGDDTQVLFRTRKVALTTPLEVGAELAAKISGTGTTCLDIVNYATANGSIVQSYPCTGQWNQVWQRQPNNTLKNPQSGRCLDLRGYGTANGALAQLWDCTGTSNQIWMRQPDGSLRNPASGRCLDLANFATGPGGGIQLWDCTSAYNQVWQANNSGALVNPQAERCLDVAGAGTVNGTHVQNWSCVPWGNQVWQVRADGTVRNGTSGRCLDIAGAATAAGSPVQLWDCTAGSGQRWAPQADGTLTNPASGRCLDAGGSAVAGVQLTIEDGCVSSGVTVYIGTVLFQ
jgi:hypothetical protein